MTGSHSGTGAVPKHRRHGVKRANLWRNGDFLRLWAGQTISLLGSRVTDVALPLTAILVLDATPAQVGLLNAAEYVPVLFITLLGGVLADRRRRRPLLLWANVGRALILGIVPVLGWQAGLSMPVLYMVAMTAGILTAQFDVTYISYLPTLVDKRDLVEGNSKLQSSQSVAQVAGQGASGVLVQLLTAPGAIIVDALSFVVSAITLLLIRTPEPPPPMVGRKSVLHDAAEGLRLTWRSRLLRVLMIESAWFNFLNDVLLVVVPIYALRTLHLQPAALGVIIACGSVGALLGAILAGRVARRVGVGRAMGYGMLCACLAYLGIPLASGSRTTVIALLFLCYAAYGAGMAIFNVHSLSLRQSLVPNSIMGRVVASYRLVSWAAIPVGGVLGGIFAGIFGARPTLMVTGSALVVGAVVFLRSRVAAVRDLDSVLPADRLQDPREVVVGTMTSLPPAPAVMAAGDGDVDGNPTSAH